jgi:hypothetical protein
MSISPQALMHYCFAVVVSQNFVSSMQVTRIASTSIFPTKFLLHYCFTVEVFPIFVSSKLVTIVGCKFKTRLSFAKLHQPPLNSSLQKGAGSATRILIQSSDSTCKPRRFKLQSTCNQFQNYAQLDSKLQSRKLQCSFDLDYSATLFNRYLNRPSLYTHSLTLF